MGERPRFELRQFDPTSMKAGRNCLYTGRAGTGKTTLMFDVAGKKPKPHFAVAMTPSPDVASDFRRVLPRSCVYESYRRDVVEKAADIASALVENGKEKFVEIYLDDCMSEKGMMAKSPAYRTIAMRGRHMGPLAYTNCVQYLMDMPADIRSQIHYVFCMKETSKKNIKKLYEDIFSMVPTLKMFEKIFKMVTEDYKCLVLDNTLGTSDPEKCLFWYKAERKTPDYKLCKPVYWRIDRATRRKKPARTVPLLKARKVSDGDVDEVIRI